LDMSITQNQDLGPLPESSRSQELEEQSLAAFRSALPVNAFRLRDERIIDAGVDASLELLIDGHYTNMRAQIQIKSTDQEEFNTDGSFSLSVKTSNLNYLLNGTSPLYILYIAPRNEIRYAWAHDEYRRISDENPNWKEQGTITIRFAETLNEQTLEQIHERIRKDTQVSHEIYDRLSRVSSNEQLIISLNPENLIIKDSHEINNTLNSSGLAIVSAGYALQIIGMVNLMSSHAIATPRIQLVKGFAEFTLSKFRTALDSLGEANMQREKLTKEDQQFLDYLLNITEFRGGIISRDEYSKRNDIISKDASGQFALDAQLDKLYNSQLYENDIESAAKIVLNLRKFVDEILLKPDIDDVFKLRSRVILIDAEGQIAARDFLRKMQRLRLRSMIDKNVDFNSIIESDSQRWINWGKEIQQILTEVQKHGHPLLMGDVMLTWVKIQVVRLMNARILENMSIPYSVADSRCKELLSDIEKTIHIYVQAGQLESEIRAKLIMAEIYIVFDDTDAACKIAEAVLPKAQAMNYENLKIQAQQFLAHESPFDKMKEVILRKGTEDEDFKWSSESDDNIKIMASDLLNLWDIPSERLPFLERDGCATRDIARERIEWCKYMQLEQNLTHTRSVNTLYARDPERKVKCEKHNYESLIPSAEWKDLIVAFKKTRCEGCADRSPKKRDTK